jgi:hypothetical protein
VFAASVPGAAVQPKNTLPAEWHSLLDAFVQHDAPGKALVMRKAEDASVHLRALATILLSEWDVVSSAELLKRPRIIEVPKLPQNNTVVQAELFLVSAEISDDGRVLSATFLRQPNQKTLGIEVLSKVKQSVFRPAFRDGKFVPAETTIDYLVHVK